MADTSKATGEKFDLTVEKKDDDEAVSRFEGEGGAPAAEKRAKPAAKAEPRDGTRPEAAPAKEEKPEEVSHVGSSAQEDLHGADAPVQSNEERAQRDARLTMARDGSRIEERPLTHPGLEGHDYSVERELREQWPQLDQGE